MISIQEETAFGQTITAVLDDGSIKDLRKGEVSEHAKQCARWHAKRQNQGMISIKRVDSADSFLPATEKNHG